MKRPRHLASLAALLLAVAAPRALALEAPLDAADPVFETHLRHLARVLRCLVCGEQRLAESDTAIGGAALLTAPVLGLGAAWRRRTPRPADRFEPVSEHLARESIP